MNIRRWLGRGNHAGSLCLVVALGLAVGGGVSIAHGLADQRQVAATRDRGDIPHNDSQPRAGSFLGYAIPTAVRIPSINVDSPLVSVGRLADGSIDTPKAPDFDKAAWYHDSPAPGQYGAAVIVGHVDSYANNNGASVFYNLSKLKPGDTIAVDRTDHSTATFMIYATRQFDRQRLPADVVYQPHTADAELRLITCAGQFDTASGEYSSNTVIFASLVHPDSVAANR